MIGDCIPLLFLLVWVFCKQKLLFFHLVCWSHFGDKFFFPPKSWSTFWLRGTASTPAPSARTGSRAGPPHQYRVQEEQYNRYIAGGDRFDQNLNHLRVTIGGKKWYWWIVTWLLDTALQNSGQLHKKAGGQMSNWACWCSRGMWSAPCSGRVPQCAAAEPALVSPEPVPLMTLAMTSCPTSSRRAHTFFQ